MFELKLPALRERGDDILLLTEAFLADISRTLGRPPAGISLVSGGVVIPIATNARPDEDPEPLPMPYRITVRIDDQTRRAPDRTPAAPCRARRRYRY